MDMQNIKSKMNDYTTPNTHNTHIKKHKSTTKMKAWGLLVTSETLYEIQNRFEFNNAFRQFIPFPFRSREIRILETLFVKSILFYCILITCDSR